MPDLVSRSWLIAVASLVLASPRIAVAEDPPATPAADPAVATPPIDPATTAATKGAAQVEETKAAAYSQPQVPTFRGGSLGIPTLGGGEVAQAAAVGKVASGGGKSDGGSKSGAAVDFNFFTKVGGLNLYDTIYADIIGESYDQAIPQVVLGAAGALPKMVTTTITSAGIRLKYRFTDRPVQVVRYEQIEPVTGRDGADKAAVVNLNARQIFAGSTGRSLTLGLRMLHPGVAGAEADRIAGLAGEVIFQQSTNLHTTGAVCAGATKAVKDAKAAAAATPATLATPPPSTGPAPLVPDAAGAGTDGATPSDEARAIDLLDQVGEIKGLAEVARVAKAEVSTAKVKAATVVAEACQNGDRRRTWFASLSGTYLNSQTLATDAGMTLDLPSFREVRAAAGFEVQAGKEEVGLLLPRVGTYVTVSRGVWTNAYTTTPAQSADAHGWQVEAAVYASGHFAGGFSGLLSFGVLLPYGHDAEPQGFINISPSIGTTLGGGS